MHFLVEHAILYLFHKLSFAITGSECDDDPYSYIELTDLHGTYVYYVLYRQ